METKERRVVPVDEKVIHAMMAGEVPGIRLDSQLPPIEGLSTDVDRQEETVPVARPRKRREQKGYAGIFLERSAPVPRKHTYISVDLYNELMDTLPVVARGLTIPNFLENILRHHLDQYRDEIDELFDNKTKKRYQ